MPERILRNVQIDPTSDRPAPDCSIGFRCGSSEVVKQALKRLHAPPRILRVDRITDVLVVVCFAPSQARLGDKDGQRDAQAFVFYWLGVDWFSPENRVHNEASDLAGKLDLAGLDLCQKRAPESLGRHRPSGLRVANELADVLLRDPPSRQKLDQVAADRSSRRWGSRSHPEADQG